MKRGITKKDLCYLLRYGLFLTGGNNYQAEELVQIVLLKACEKDLLYKENITIAYLKKMMKNQFLNDQKKYMEAIAFLKTYLIIHIKQMNVWKK